MVLCLFVDVESMEIEYRKELKQLKVEFNEKYQNEMEVL